MMSFTVNMKGMKHMKRLMSLLISAAMILSTGASVSAADAEVSPQWKTITISESLAAKKTDASTKEVKVTSVKVSESEITLKKGETYTIKATISPKDASNKKVTYSSSDRNIVKVSSKGVITALKNGTATITVKAADGSGKKAVINVTVSAKKPSDKTTDSKTSGKKTNAKTTNGFDAKKTSMDIVKDMGAGWNLGNSLDALGTGLNSETAWGNPKTTKKMIDDICGAGIKTIRIPVSWGKHCDENGNVDKDWMKRVKEVVDYAYDNGVYVILNSHHDNTYYDIGGCVKSENTLNSSVKKMNKLWKQIANEFKNYDEHLIFETLNEPRTEGSAKEWSGGTAEEREVVAKLNEEIVKTIRSTGGNNAYRQIMVPAYAATASTNILKQMKVPDDDNIIVSVHAYSPYFFAMDANGSNKFTDNDKKELDRFFKDLNSIFVSKGTLVVIGEFGATNKKNLDDRVAWAEYYVKGAKQYNIPCVLWDNNSGRQSGGECFGVYSRDRQEFTYPEIIEAIVKAAK